MVAKKTVKTPTTVEEVEALINKSFGKDTLVRASASDLHITRIPTGILSIDVLTNGGFARGRHVEVYGGYSTGKTSMFYRFIANAQRLGLRCAFLDAEGTFDPVFAEAQGVDLTELSIQPRQEFGEQTVNMMEIMLRSGLYDVIILDSISALVPKYERETSMDKATFGTQQAKLMSAALRRLTAANKKTVLGYINQQRESVGSMFQKWTTSGGRAMAFYAGTRLDMTKIETITQDVAQINHKSGNAEKSKEVIAHRVLVKVDKDKMQPVSEPVLTPCGWKPIGDIEVGDKVMGGSGQPVEVVGVYPQQDDRVWRVEFTDGSWTRCGPEHLWYAKHAKRKDWEVTTTEDMLAAMNRPSLWRVPLSAMEYEEKQLPISPYLMGALLGDGGLSRGVSFSSVDLEILARVRQELPEGCVLKHRECDRPADYVIVGSGTGNPLIDSLRDLGLFGKRSWEKSIPDIYLRSSKEQRIDLLRGLMDTVGSTGYANRPSTQSTAAIGLSSELLIEGVVDLVQGLGGTALRSIRKTTHRDQHVARLTMPVEINPFWLSRKADNYIPRSKYLPCKIIRSIVVDEPEESVCIRVAAEDSLYVTRGHIITHNTGVRPHAKTTFVFDYRLGRVDHIEDLMYLGRVNGLIGKKNAVWWVKDFPDEKVTGRDNFKDWLRDSVAIAEELEEMILEATGLQELASA